MRYFLDTEFYEKPGYLELISIGIVDERGRELYAENALFDWRQHDPVGSFDTDGWLWRNVKPHLGPPEDRLLPSQIAMQIIGFVGHDHDPQFWAYFADYDWVAFCWLFGRMLDLPQHFPKWCRDLKQLIWHLGVKREYLPKQVGTEHNALADAKQNLQVWQYLRDVAYGDGSGLRV